MSEDVKTGFTPGPWKAVLQFGDWMVRQDPKDWDGKGYQFVAGLPASRKGTHYGDMFKANAVLISAAPDLLKFAELVEYYGRLRDEKANGQLTRGQWDMLRKQARAVISKATGASQ